MSDEPDAAAPQRVTLDEAILAAQHLQRSGKLAQAEAIYQQILQALPEEPNALHYLGVLRHQQQRNAEAIQLIRQAAARLPGDSGPWVNLGNVLLEMQRYDDAVDAYRQAADYAPENFLIYNNLGLMYTRRGHFDKAEPAYRRALEIAPDAQFVLVNYANLLWRAQRYEESVAYGLKSLAINSNDAGARRVLSTSYALLGDNASARKVLQEWLALEPGNPMALHMLAGVGGAAVPARASDEFIVAEFDDFAGRFDAKLESLGYRAPALVAAALAAAIAPATVAGDILDAGCGTGLCAPHLAPLATRLDGVDLSAGMLEKARQRGGYANLAQAELTAYIAGRTAYWNAIVSADTLCYFGDLAPVFAAAKNALRAGGVLVFSVEALLEGDLPYRLNADCRYQHTRGYLENTLRGTGYERFSIEQTVLRMETMRPVQGWVVAARIKTG